MTLYEGKRFKREGDNPWIYEIIEFTNNTIKAHCTNQISGFGEIVVMSEQYFNDCDKLGLWEEC